MRQAPQNPIDSDELAPSRPPRPAAGQRRHVIGPGKPRRRRFVLRSPRPATVWPCFGQARQDGTQLLAAWLQTAIVKIVTAYTQPGDRVLLLTAPAVMGTSTGQPNDQRVSLSEFAGLGEAAWTVARLGRSIRTWTGGPPPVDDSAGPIKPPQSESGLRPAAINPDRACASTADPDTDRFDLIITAVVPHAIGWAETIAWPNVVRPGGTLAIITHSDIRDGRLLDPTGPLVTTVRHHGLAWLDHVVLLKTPIADTPSPSGVSTRQGPWLPSRHTRVHDDLLLFTAAHNGTVEEDSSDE